MTHGAYQQAVRLKSDEIGIITDDVLEIDDAKELILILPTNVLEYVVNNPGGVNPKHKWDDKWVALCQNEYASRVLLL